MIIGVWGLIGVLLGLLAAQRRGFNSAAAAVVGLILGPFAVLMFFVDGLIFASERRLRCPSCQEWVRPGAAVCPHCRSSVAGLQPAGPGPVARGASIAVRGVLILFLVLVAVAIVSVG